MLLLRTFLLAMTALLPLINPIGSALVFVGLVGDAPPATYLSLARKVALASFAFLVVVEFLGEAILSFFGNSKWECRCRAERTTLPTTGRSSATTTATGSPT